MATARISESLWTCAKRWLLEAAVERSGHRWSAARLRAPMCAAECVARLLAQLDARCHPDGSMADMDAEHVEFIAGWTGKPGVLTEALIRTGWIDQTEAGMFWHDYGSFNGSTLRDRLKKRALRPGTGRGHRADLRGDKVGDKVGDEVGEVGGDEVGASGSGSGSGSGVRSPSPKNQIPGEAPGAPALHPLAVAWNEAARPAGLALVGKIAPTRAKHIAARLREEPELAVWAKAFALIAADPFCKGVNERGWRADFDYALRPEKCAKWLDAARSGQARPETGVERMERLLKEAGA